MAFVDYLKTKSPEGFGGLSTADEVCSGADLSGKYCLITGIRSGIGRETGRALAKAGMNIIGLARRESEARDTLDGFAGEAHHAVGCDLGSPSSIARATEQVTSLDVPLSRIILNAGVMNLPERTIIEEHEGHFLVNHLGHFGLFKGLHHFLEEDGRVLVLSSEAHRRTYPGGIDYARAVGEGNYVPFRAYGMSKLANLLFAKELHRRLTDRQEAFAIHPGVIRTPLMRHLPSIAQWGMKVLKPIFFKSIEQGAATTCFAATSKGLTGQGGSYLKDCKITAPSRHGRDAELAKGLWDYSEEWWSERSPGSNA